MKGWYLASRALRRSIFVELRSEGVGFGIDNQEFDAIIYLGRIQVTVSREDRPKRGQTLAPWKTIHGGLNAEKDDAAGSGFGPHVPHSIERHADAAGGCPADCGCE